MVIEDLNMKGMSQALNFGKSVAGDAMISVDGILRGPVQQTTPDIDTALCSLGKFLDFDIESVICYHGGLCDDNVKGQLQNLVRQGHSAVYIRE